MFRRYGYTGTGMKKVVVAANAPFGSLYHHFPGGKEQLGMEVVRRSGRMYFKLFEAIYDRAPDPVAGLGDFFAGAAERFAAAGIPDAEARKLAISVIVALEGAFVLARALRSTEPVEVVGEGVTAAVRAALPG